MHFITILLSEQSEQGGEALLIYIAFIDAPT